MALNPGALALLIRQNMLANPATGAVDGPALTAMCSAIASAVVAHITSAAVVAGTATGAMSGGPGVPVVGTVT